MFLYEGSLLDPLLSVLILLTVSGFIASTFQRFGFGRILGYIFGGIIIAYIALHFHISVDFSYTDALREIGLVLFFFEAGSSISISGLRASFSRVVAIELVSITFIWTLSSIVSFTLGFSQIERLFTFLLLVNCSMVTFYLISSDRGRLGTKIKQIATLQFSMEDIVQFSLFSILFSFSSSNVGIISGFQLFLKIAALSLIMFASAYLILRILSSSALVQEKTNKFILSLAIALGYVSISQYFGLPPLFGAFISGLAFSSTLGAGEIADMLVGMKEIGMLFYFSSLGADIGLFNSIKVIKYGIILGMLAVPIRMIGLFIGGILGGVTPENASLISLTLFPIAESGIIFADTLASSGMLASQMVGISTIAVMSTLIVSGAISSRIDTFALKLISFIPLNTRKALDGISKLYFSSIETLVGTFAILTRFVAIVLLVSYLSDMFSLIFQHINLSFSIEIIIRVIIGVLGSSLVLLAFIVTTNSMLRFISKRFNMLSNSSSGNIGRVFVYLFGGITLVIELQLLYESLSWTKEYFGIEFFGINLAFALMIIFLTLFFMTRRREAVKRNTENRKISRY
ncbi:Na_H_Exchanger domain containing protein [Fervidicoccus fontis Kam940]|uniref:Na_H_Exchanger domain containing protein n=1 Tax=Fervidicoccus fontis (strain DSM 19380 / JCM 18336 / VKM B-2539 / Kam940) TaxID=1163730 RepID=I0A0Q9_FERFK|nr:Na_H_Exchanger domain containing protein [Fervidicoccus fontis Kam940]